MIKQIIEETTVRFTGGQDTVLSLERVHTEDTATFVCEGEFRGELVQDVEALLLSYIRAGFILYLDLAKITYIANSMQDALISVQKEAESGNMGLLVLRSLSEHVLSELEDTGVIDCLTVLGVNSSQNEIDSMVKAARSRIPAKPLTPPVISRKEPAHTHDHRPVRTVPPTCAAEGYTLFECNCGDAYNGDFTPRLPHRYTASVIDPTELEQGYTLHKCSCCGHTYTSDIIAPLHKHDYKAVETVKPTCIKEGYTRFVCGCGDSYKGNFTAKGPHSYLETVIAPTTEAGGYTLHKCSVCGHEFKDQFTDPIHVHSYKALQTVPATCAAEGFIRYVCDCGDSYTESIPRLSHQYVTTVVAPTEEAKGYDLHRCSLCGHEFKDNYVDPVHVHNYQVAQTVPPTCTEDGYTRYACSCGDSYNDNFIPKLEHQYVTTVTEPTQNSQGLSRHRCRLCGHTYTEIIPIAHEHDYQLVTEIPATCSCPGTRQYRCSCGKGHTEYIPMLIHEYVSTTVPPTEDAQGYDLHTCIHCGHEIKNNYTPALSGTVADPPPGTVKDPTNGNQIRELLLIQLRTGIVRRFTQSMIAMGRHTHQCDFVITGNDRISNHHADIVVYKDRVSLRDNGSTNGTFVGQQKLEANKAVPLTCPAFFRLQTEDFLLLWGAPAVDANQTGRVALLKNTAEGSYRLPDRYPFLLGRHNPWQDGVTMTSRDMKVGRQHAQILIKDGVHHLERLHQTNGTRLNGRYLDLGAPEALSNGDQIRVGDTTLEFRLIDTKEILL